MPTKPKNQPKDAPQAEATGQDQVRSYQALFKHFVPIAARLPEAEVQVCRADPRIVLVNVKRGIERVCGTKEQVRAVREHLPKLPLDEVLELPDLARALLFASREALPKAAGTKEIEKALAEISGPREEMLTQAELFARRGLLDAERVANIRSGSGKYDTARDGMELAALFTAHAAALKGLHPFSQEEIEKLQRTSEWLLENLNPSGARVDPKRREKSPAEDARDRFWTLITQRHPALRKIGYYFHGEDVDQVTPRLLSRVKPGQVFEEELQEPDDAPVVEGEPGESGSDELP